MGNLRFVNNAGISTNQMREMVEKYSKLKTTQKWKL